MIHTTKPRNVVPKYEDTEHLETLAITLAPDDKLQFFDVEQRLEKFHSATRTQLTIAIKQTCYLRLRTEVSSLGRLHYHGYVTIRDRIKFYLYTIPFLQGLYTINIKSITDEMGWDNYCQKQGINQDWILIPYLQTCSPNLPPKQRARAKNVCSDSEPDLLVE